MPWLKRGKEQDLRAELESFDAFLTADYPFDRGVYAGFKEAEYLELFDRFFSRTSGHYKLALDLGSGVGLSSLLLGQYADQVCSIDLSTAGFRRLPDIVKPGERMPWLLGANACQAPFRPGVFDAIFVGGLLHHLPNWPILLEEIARVLAPTGCLVLVEPNLLNLPQTVKFLVEGGHGDLSPNEFPLRLTKVVGLCRRYFSEVEGEYVGFNHQVVRLADLTKPGFTDLLEKVYYKLAPVPFWSQFFVVACHHKK